MKKQKFYRIGTLGNADDHDYCLIENFVDGINAHSARVHVGERLAPVYPADAKILLRGTEKGLKLGSFVGNTRNMMLVSTQFRRLIEEACVGVPIEYLPVSIHDHRKRLLSDDHHIVNPLGTFDCLDLQKTNIKYSRSTPGEIVNIQDLVLDRTKTQDAPQLFRVKEDPTSYLVGLELAQAIYDADLTNVVWRPLPFST